VALGNLTTNQWVDLPARNPENENLNSEETTGQQNGHLDVDDPEQPALDPHVSFHVSSELREFP